jgi:hypothetical protein
VNEETVTADLLIMLFCLQRKLVVDPEEASLAIKDEQAGSLEATDEAEALKNESLRLRSSWFPTGEEKYFSILTSTE